MLKWEKKIWKYHINQKVMGTETNSFETYVIHVK